MSKRKLVQATFRALVVALFFSVLWSGGLTLVKAAGTTVGPPGFVDDLVVSFLAAICVALVYELEILGRRS